MSYYENSKSVTDLVGKVFTKVENRSHEEIVFWQGDEEKFKMLHIQDCCESVYVEDIDNDLDVLVDTEILEAYESTNHDQSLNVEDYTDDSFTWTFYKFRTAKGWITIRWYGSSNGYYSESVDLIAM